MWHEARKQERKIRGMLVDYRRRAERRRDFYEKIKADPTQFLQLHGRQCKIHLDASIAAAADSPATMMPWQGQADNLIDRFDVRAHLDYIAPIIKLEEEELGYEERQINYERYRIIAQNSFLGVSEEKFLKQLQLEEQFGYTEVDNKKKKTGGAAIGFNYEDGSVPFSSVTQPATNEDSSDGNSDSDLDVDLYINVSKVDQYQAHEMNKHGLNFGMSSNDFYSFLTNDMEEAETNRLAREEEHEKVLFSGRKSRRERRAHREKRLANRVISPPSYAARTSPTYPCFRESKSASRSPSPENSGKITYITSFGDDDDAPTTSNKASYADKLKYGSKSKRRDNISSETRTITIVPRRPRFSDRDRGYRKRQRSRSAGSRSPRWRKRSKSRERFKTSRSNSKDARRRYRPKKSSSSSSSSRSASRSKTRKSPVRTKRRSLSKSRRSRSGSKNSRRRRSQSSLSSVSSRSLSKSRSLSTKRSKSRSLSAQEEEPPKVTVSRYYGRKRSDQSSSSELEETNDNDDRKAEKPAVVPAPNNQRTITGNAGTTSKKNQVSVPFSASMNLQERLKRKRQAMLNKQFKADKLAEQLKSEREKQEQQNREDELREMAIKFRRRQREIRHAYDSHNSSSSSDSDSSKRSLFHVSRNRTRSRSLSPRDRREDRDYKNKDGRSRFYRDRDKSREKRDSNSARSSPKTKYEPETRVVYKVDASSPERDYKRSDHKKEGRRDGYKDKTGRSLVDY